MRKKKKAATARPIEDSFCRRLTPMTRCAILDWRLQGVRKPAEQEADHRIGSTGDLNMPTKKAPEMVVEPPAEGKEARKALYTAARKVLLAGIGAIALAEEAIEDLVKRLVERGEIAEQDGRRLLRETRGKMRRRQKEARKTEQQLTGQVEEAISRPDVASKADVEALIEKIDQLSRKIDSLKKAEPLQKD